MFKSETDARQQLESSESFRPGTPEPEYQDDAHAKVWSLSVTPPPMRSTRTEPPRLPVWTSESRHVMAASCTPHQVATRVPLPPLLATPLARPRLPSPMRAPPGVELPVRGTTFIRSSSCDGVSHDTLDDSGDNDNGLLRPTSRPTSRSEHPSRMSTMSPYARLYGDTSHELFPSDSPLSPPWPPAAPSWTDRSTDVASALSAWPPRVRTRRLHVGERGGRYRLASGSTWRLDNTAPSSARSDFFTADDLRRRALAVAIAENK